MALLRKVGIPLVMICVSSLATLGLAEVGLRLLRPVQYLKPPSPPAPGERRQSLYRPSSVPGLSYEMIPLRNGDFEGMHVRTNSLGMRGPELAPPGDRRIRVAVLGDSFTFGFGVAEEDTYPAVLQRLLNASGPAGGGSFEVLNLGVVGYNTRDEAAVLQYKALPFDPRLIIIGYVLNDPEIDPRQSLHKYFDAPVWWRHSHVLRLLHLGMNWIEVYRYGGGDYIRYLHAPGREKWASVVKAFGRIRALAEGRGARVLLAIFPLVPEDSWASYRYRDLHARVGAAAAAEGFQVIDLLPIFSRYPPADLRLSREDDHPSRLAHGLAARALADAILARQRRASRDGAPR